MMSALSATHGSLLPRQRCTNFIAGTATVHALTAFHTSCLDPVSLGRIGELGGQEMTNPINNLFAAALGVAEPWFVDKVDFDAAKKEMIIRIDFRRGTRFPHPRAPGEHKIHDTETKRLRHLNFFQHECILEVRVPRVKLPDGVALVEPDWFGKLSGFTLLFEALVLMLARHMPFSAVAQTVGESWHRVHAICERYVDIAVAEADLSETSSVVIDETSYKRGHRYLTLVADADARKVVHVSKGASADNIAGFVQHLRNHNGSAHNITSATIDMSPAFIKGVTENLPEAEITFDKFHVIAQASEAVSTMRRLEQGTDPQLKGMRWVLLKDRRKLSREQAVDLNELISRVTTIRTARAWLYREQLRDILSRRQYYVVSTMLRQWCTNVMRSKVNPMKAVAMMIRRHFEGIVNWARSRQTSGFMEAINGLFQATKRKARGYTRFSTMRTVIFLIAGKLNLSAINPHVALPT
jgi:transposase